LTKAQHNTTQTDEDSVKYIEIDLEHILVKFNFISKLFNWWIGLLKPPFTP